MARKPPARGLSPKAVSRWAAQGGNRTPGAKCFSSERRSDLKQPERNSRGSGAPKVTGETAYGQVAAAGLRVAIVWASHPEVDITEPQLRRIMVALNAIVDGIEGEPFPRLVRFRWNLQGAIGAEQQDQWALDWLERTVLLNRPWDGTSLGTSLLGSSSHFVSVRHPIKHSRGKTFRHTPPASQSLPGSVAQAIGLRQSRAFSFSGSSKLPKLNCSQQKKNGNHFSLFVTVSPQRPRIEYNASQVLPGHNLTALHGEVAAIKCVSHYGNPPPVLKWFLDQNEITPSRRQTNSTELDNPRTWMAISVLELTISKENHGRTLRCVAVHESYSTKSSSIEVRLDVMYVPETRLVGIPTNDIEELKDSVAVRCMVNSNPRASVTWRREGQSVAASFQELLQFSPAVRQHAGLYTCHARNQAGESPPLRFHLDVKYPPKILSVGPDRLTTAPLFTSATFECIAEGNPQPTYQWLQRYPTPSDFILERGRESKLHVPNVTYDYQGEYVCKVTNIIGGIERTVQSESIALQVVGAPQVLRHSIKPEIRVEKGESADLRVVVCADPRPRVMAWEWGSVRMEAGSTKGRFKVDDVTEEEREDCYSAALHISDADSVDSRAYYLAVENDKGKDKHAVLLYVNEPMQLSTLVTLAGGALAAFLLLVCACIYAIKTEKCCFSRKGDFKPTDLDR
ncbi:hemicentin-2 [Photinus pyralis]|nr:hemicentin-2 [Photinus pyralis]